MTLIRYTVSSIKQWVRKFRVSSLFKERRKFALKNGYNKKESNSNEDTIESQESSSYGDMQTFYALRKQLELECASRHEIPIDISSYDKLNMIMDELLTFIMDIGEEETLV